MDIASNQFVLWLQTTKGIRSSSGATHKSYFVASETRRMLRKTGNAVDLFKDEFSQGNKQDNRNVSTE